ncbi:GNAT family N-acetyltransferase [Pseudaeromonas sharmana]|uniref:GNAT family N-acetyltransferase n=1 Tax=Pseudaeromonas sharmana TaxID=328412 RepID=A0ABV8CR85_9GAMM
MSRYNEYGQPVGEAVSGWSRRALPERRTFLGAYCMLEPLDASQHAASLFSAFSQAADGRDWTYLPVGPFPDLAAYRDYLAAAASSQDPGHYAVIDLASGDAIGTLALMRMDPGSGVIEVGHVTFSPRLQQTRLATEAHFLLMRYVFDELRYRRYEWKCDALNAPSRQAALRLGFQFEGIFRQALVYKQRTRDTAWFSVIDSDWPLLRAGFARWLCQDNFTAQGQQRCTLAACRAPSAG